MIYCQVCIFLGVLWLLATCWSLNNEFSNRRPELVKRMIFCFALAAIYKYNFGIQFWGLEYEDAFAFHHSAQLLARNIFPNSFLVEGVMAGSVEHPWVQGTYGGHYIMVPSLLSLLYRLISESVTTFNIFNTAMAFLSMLILSSLNCECKSGWWVAPLVYCAAPILNVFSTAALCETFSSTVVISYVFFCLRSKETDDRMYLLFSCLAFAVSIMTKRENLILFALPAILWVVDSFKKFSEHRIKVLCGNYLLLCVIVIVYFVAVQNVIEIENIEAKDIHAPTFSIAYCLRLLPRFLLTICDLRYYSFVFPIVCASLWFGWRNKRCRAATVTSIIVFGLYLFAYSCHYRGYDFVVSGRVNSFDTFRYLNNFTVLLFVPLSFVVYPRTKMLNIFCVLLMLYPLFETVSLRKYLSKIEDQSRFEVVRNSIKALAHRGHGENTTILITDKVLLYQVSQPKSFNVCDIRIFAQSKYNMFDADVYLVVDRLEDVMLRYGLSIDLSAFKVVDEGLNPFCPKVYKYVGKNKGGVFQKCS